MSLADFLKFHKIIAVGNPLPEYICTEMIVDDPVSFVKLIVKSGYYIPYILWWERGEIGSGTKLGMGGPPDPRAPEKYFFSEVTHIDRSFDVSTTEEEYIRYIEKVISNHPGCDLYPGFDVAPKRLS